MVARVSELTPSNNMFPAFFLAIYVDFPCKKLHKNLNINKKTVQWITDTVYLY